MHGIPTEHVEGTYDLKRVAHHGSEKDHWKQKRQELAATLQANNDFRTRSDFAVVLLHLGETDRAIEILEEVESDVPGE